MSKKINKNKDNMYMCNDRIDILIDRDLKKNLRIMLMQEDKTITDFIINKIKEYVNENNKKQ